MSHARENRPLVSGMARQPHTSHSRNQGGGSKGRSVQAVIPNVKNPRLGHTVYTVPDADWIGIGACDPMSRPISPDADWMRIGALAIRCYDRFRRVCRLAGFQGPAICVFNNAVFSDTDFDSITRIGDSRKTESRTKVSS